MKLSFTTKEESNRRREEEFLALSASERVLEFLRFSKMMLREYPSAIPKDYGNNLILELPLKTTSAHDGME